MSKPYKQIDTATFGGGCFWCIEPLFQDLQGVLTVESGYSGGWGPAEYRAVCEGTTGHAEVIQVTFDASVISFEELMEVFFTVHDPTTLNRQGNDSGTQYRSVVFYHSPEQQVAAQEAKAKAERLWNKPVVTEIVPLEVFHKAEAYHQNYYHQNPYQPYCSIVIGPKVKKFREKFAAKRKTA